ncbi:MAG: family transcriptional regulator [Chloroflexi bacterium]|nr:family transcriptional regulator [Chloroflexota bacterium]
MNPNPGPMEVHRETIRRVDLVNRRAGEEIRRMRLDANVSIAAVARVTGIAAAHIGRVEAGKAQPSTRVLTAIGVAPGAELSLRYFPSSGPRIHDRFQAPMIENLLRSLHPRWRAEVEVPTLHPVRGVIDAVLRDRLSETIVAAEVHSDLRRIEQQIRWGRAKSEALASDETATGGPSAGPAISQLLVLRSTVRTRDLARQYGALLGTAFPARSADVFAALFGPDAPWPGAGILWVHLHGSRSSVMRFPPHGVRLGR